MQRGWRLGRRLLIGALLAAALLGSGAAGGAPARDCATACGPPQAEAAPAPQRTTARIGVLGISSEVGLYLAHERGYFAEQGLDVQLEDIVTGQGSIPPLSAGQLDVGVGGISAGLFNAMARGIDIKLVATKGSAGTDPQSPFAGTQALVLAADLAASGAVQDYRDLRGRPIALPERGASLELMLDKAIQPAGLSVDDFDLKLMPYPDMLAALANRSVDAAMELEPFIAQGLGRGILVRWKTGADLYPGQQAAALVFGPTMQRIGRDAGNRFILAYTRGIRDYNEAFGPKRLRRDETVAILSRNTPLKDPALYDQIGWTYLNPDCYLNIEALAWDLDWYHAHGYVAQKPDLAQTVDHRYCDYAIQQLGRYQP